jgi:hypothetical protein
LFSLVFVKLAPIKSPSQSQGQRGMWAFTSRGQLHLSYFGRAIFRNWSTVNCHQSDTILHNLSHHYSVAKFPCAWDCITVILFEIHFNRLHSFSAIKVTLVNAWGLNSTFQPSICHACDRIWFLSTSGYGWDQFQFEDLSFEIDFSPVAFPEIPTSHIFLGSIIVSLIRPTVGHAYLKTLVLT